MNIVTIAKPLVAWAMRRTLARPRLKAYVAGALANHPGLKQRLRRFALRSGLIRHEDLSPRAARIYADLKKAIEAKKKRCAS